MFCDEVEIQIEAGKGGNGKMSFHTERFVPHGGPDGGNGGSGGNIFFRINPNINTLYQYKMQKLYKATAGTDGAFKKLAGKQGEDLVLDVPPGTIVHDAETGEKIVDLGDMDELYMIARGGRGGFGNAHFVGPTRQAPRFAELGEPGELKHLKLELQLIADVGIIGMPSAGKSTLISHISNAKPKIADYPFTTLVPNLGVVSVDDKTFVVADVPGLIAGASQGKGLGDTFLKHIRRTKILLHMVDITSSDIAENYMTIRKELKEYDKAIANKPELIVINKIDTVDTETVKLFMDDFAKRTKTKKKDIYPISAVSGNGIKKLLYRILETLKTYDVEEAVLDEKDYKIFRPADQKHVDANKFTVKQTENGYEIEGQRIEQIAIMSDPKNEEALMRVYDVCKKMNIIAELEKLGIKNGDIIRIKKLELTYSDYL